MTESGQLRWKARVRSAALVALAWVDSHDRLRAASSRRAHPPGMEAFCYKQQGQVHRLHVRVTAPQGPAVSVAMEGARSVRTPDRSSLARVAIENVRLATEEELSRKAVRREFGRLPRRSRVAARCTLGGGSPLLGWLCSNLGRPLCVPTSAWEPRNVGVKRKTIRLVW